MFFFSFQKLIFCMNRCPHVFKKKMYALGFLDSSLFVLCQLTNIKFKFGSKNIACFHFLSFLAFASFCSVNTFQAGQFYMSLNRFQPRVPGCFVQRCGALQATLQGSVPALGWSNLSIFGDFLKFEIKIKTKMALKRQIVFALKKGKIIVCVFITPP